MDINLSLCELSRRGEKTQPLDYDFKLGDGKIGSDLGEEAEKADYRGRYSQRLGIHLL